MRKNIYFLFIIGSFILILFSLIISIQINFILLNNPNFDKKLSIHINEIYKQIIEKIETSQFIDKSGSYSIVPNIISPQNLHIETKKSVTLITHCSPNHLYHIIDLSKRWNGPISLSLFSDGAYLVVAIDILLNLQRCFPESFYRIRVHLIFPSNANFKINLPSFGDPVICDDLYIDLKEKTSVFKNYEYMNIDYPNNLLRNVAIKSAKTSHIFVIDIDLLPSLHLFQKLSIFLNEQSNLTEKNFNKNIKNMQKILAKNKIAYVVPSFEISESVLTLPDNKSHLLNLWDRNLLKPFYIDMCLKCQLPTNYSLWRMFQSKSQNDSLQVVLKTSWSDRWEPFTVVPISAPRFDERFRQYGFNRISQSCELHMSGYKFHVLDSVFLLHVGLKSNSSFHENKEREQAVNRMYYNVFKKEMRDKYRRTNKTCD